MHYADTFDEDFTASVTRADELIVVTLTADTCTYRELTTKEQAIEEIKDQPFFK